MTTHDSLATRLMPRAGVRTQLLLAAIVWAVGAIILITRGVYYLSLSHWAVWIVTIALVIAVLKSRFLLDRVARKAVERIRERGRDRCAGGFLSWRSWLLVGLMMGGGIMLRQTALPKAVLAVIYLAVGCGLLIGDRIYWHALLRDREPA